MVSYYNSLSYSQKHSANLSYPPTQPWFPSNYHPPPNHQFLGDVDHSHHQHMYYNPHMFHQAGTDWHSHENFQGSQSHLLTSSHTPTNQLNETINSAENLTDGLPSPPITVSGSEISSPGVPNSSSSPQSNNGNNNNAANNNSRPMPDKSPYFDWMKKPSYPAQPTPGKTRTKDKYRVVYTDFQRLELEKEYHTSRYITIRRKTELAQALQLSERQVKIWFQNRRAKERKQNKKRDDPLVGGHNGDLSSLMDTKPKLEPGLHFQHPLRQMSSMAVGISPMSLHHSVLHHGHLGVPPPPPSQHLHQSQTPIHSAVSSLAM